MALRSFLSRVVGEKLLERQHLAEHARGLGERQRRRRHQRAVGRGQHLMHAVAEFVRERHHVARLALIIEQHIRMRRRRGRMREGARRLARPHRRVDPALGRKSARRSPPFSARTRHRRSAPCPWPRPSRRCASAPAAAARCGPNAAAAFCRTISPSAHNNGATAADRRRARPRPAHRPLRARPGSTDAASSAMSAKPRQRSEISLSLASVLVISANSRTLSLNVCASACGGGLALLAGAVLTRSSTSARWRATCRRP